MSDSIDALKRAKLIMGWSEADIAEVVGVKQPSVNHILKNSQRVPAEWCLPIERATEGKVTRHELRPDLYPLDESDESSAPDERIEAAQ